MKENLIWFRNDLRLHDNTALHQACASDQDNVRALFIATPKQWNSHNMSDKQISFIRLNVISLKKDLFKLNIILYYHESTDFLHAIKYLVHFCQKHKIQNVFYNYQYEINERYRDCLVKKQLSQKNIIVKGFHDNLLVPFKKVQNQNNTTYRNFSFFKKNIIKILSENIPQSFLVPNKRNTKTIYFLDDCKYHNIKCCFDKNIFPIGEEKAIQRLQYFVKYKINDYSLEKNFPYLDSTSMLSPYLSIGIISSRYCLTQLLKKNNTSIKDTVFSSSWFNELLWREFYYHLLIGFPKLSKFQSLSGWEKNISWANNIKYFNFWKQGKTGFPIIDAGMRQLNILGWMHNRLRMITSSFLVKNLLIDWRMGEKYFMSHLIDGDLALNNGGWQWAASIGTDSVPYIRTFNPWNQSKKFDELGIFIKKYLPELKDVPDKYIHKPQEWAKTNNYKLNYPDPIIDYHTSRKKFLLVFRQAQIDFKKNRFNTL